MTKATPAASTGSRQTRLNVAFAEEEYRALVIGSRVRLIVLAVIGVWITIENGFPDVLFFYPFLLGFALLGIMPLSLRRAGRGSAWHRYLFPALEILLFTVVILVNNPLDQTTLPPTLRLRMGNELYFFAFLCSGLFTYSPAVVLWSGFAMAATWSVATLWILLQPESVVDFPDSVWATLSYDEKLAAFVHPNRVYVGQWVRSVVLFFVVSAVLATFLWRARRLVMKQANTERERANLSRYFSANMVDELAGMDEPLGTTRQQNVTVVFADIVGFTEMSEGRSPDAVIEILRQFHGRMQRAVFDHGGTLDKYIGDGVMATFGTPHSSEGDATNALLCVRGMVKAVDEWNQLRARRGEAKIRVGVGAHYGPVVIGDIGGEQRLEFAVIGDTVNTASRLERLTRELSVAAVVSGDLIDAVRQESPGNQGLLAGLTEGPEQKVRGRQGAVRVWLLDGAQAAPSS